MKKIYAFFLCVMCCTSVLMADDRMIFEDFYLPANETVSDNLIITNDVKIENHGNITGDVIIQSPVTSVRFINSGLISGNIDNYGGAFIDQIIHSGADLNKIGNLSGQDILVETGTSDRLDFNLLLEIAQVANEVTIKNTSFVIDSNFVARDVDIIIDGETIFYVDDMSDEISNFFAAHVNGMNYVNIQSSNPLFGVNSGGVGNSGNNGGAGVARQTQYGEVLGNSVGDYLDDLRDTNSEDELLNALDSAQNINEFNNILSQSVRMHPIRLMNFSKTFNTFNLNRDVYTDSGGLALSPFYINSDKFDILGINADFVIKLSDDFYASVGGFGARMKYSGSLDEFASMLYGVSFGAKYENSDFFVCAKGITFLADFYDTNVFDGVGTINNPTGWGANADLDFGLVFALEKASMKIKPFMGAVYDYVAILGDGDTDIDAKFGAEAELLNIVDGNKYGYGIKSFVQTDGTIYGGVFANMISVVDGIGGALNAAILKDDNKYSYKISLDINFKF